MLTATQVTVSRSALLATLGRVALVVARNKLSIPIIGAVHIAPEANGLRFTATDFDRTVSSVAACDDPREDFEACAVPCLRLLAVVTQLPAGTVTITQTAKGIRVAAGSTRFDLVGMPVGEFPFGEPLATASPLIAVGAPALLASLSRLASHVSSEPSRPALNGMCVESQPDGGLEIVATDGYRMARETLSAPSAKGLKVLLPSNAVATLIKLFDGASEVGVQLDGQRAAFCAIDGDDIRFVTRTIDAAFPDVHHFFKVVLPERAIVDRIALLAAVRRMASLSTSDSLLIRLEWSRGSVRVCAIGDTDAGDAEDVVPCDFNGPSDRSIHFSPRYLVDALVVRQADTVWIDLKNGDSHMALRDAGSLVVQSLVMPRRDPRK